VLLQRANTQEQGVFNRSPGTPRGPQVGGNIWKELVVLVSELTLLLEILSMFLAIIVLLV